VKRKRWRRKRGTDETAACGEAEHGGTPTVAAVAEAEAIGRDATCIRTISLDSYEPMVESASDHGDSETDRHDE